MAVKKQHVNEALSFFNTELEKLADLFIEKFIPEDSKLRNNPILKRGFDLFTSWIKGRAGKVSNPFLSAIMEKSSDFLEYVSDRLDNKKEGDVSGKKQKKDISSKAAESIRAAFVGKIFERLEKAGDMDMEKEAEKIKKELQLFDDIFFGKKEEPVIADDKPKGKGFWESFNEADKNAANWLRKFRGEKKGEWQ